MRAINSSAIFEISIRLFLISLPLYREIESEYVEGNIH